MECTQIHTYYTNEEGDEEEDVWGTQRELELRFQEQKDEQSPEYCSGNNQMVKTSNQKSVICFENPNVHACRQCFRRCIC